MIFQQLETPLDLARCCAVSKHWAGGIYSIRPTTMRLHCIHSNITASDSLSEIRWLQTWHKQGRLQQVQNLVLEETVPPKYNKRKSWFSQNVIICAGLWNLRSCSLNGPFCVESAVGLLPTSLQNLSLCPKSGPEDFCLSAFQRFTCLESLTLSWCTLSFDPQVGLEQYPCSLWLDRCFMSNLHKLDCLSPTGSHGVGFTCLVVFSLQECLPNLNSLMLGISHCDLESEDEAIEFACDVAAWHGLQRLHLELDVDRLSLLDTMMQADVVCPADLGITVTLKNNPDLAIIAKGSLDKLTQKLHTAGITYQVQC